MKLSRTQSRDLTRFFLHLLGYGALLFLYFILVLRFLAGWLKVLFEHHRGEYALVAIVIMIGQAVGLEGLSYLLIRLIHWKKK